MKLVQCPIAGEPRPDWKDCAQVLRRVIAASGPCSRNLLLQRAGEALDIQNSERLEKALKHLVRTTDIAGSAESTLVAPAPPRILEMPGGLPGLKLGHFATCRAREFIRTISLDTEYPEATRMKLDDWEGCRQDLGPAWISARLAELQACEPRGALDLKAEVYNVSTTKWSSAQRDSRKWLLLRSARGRHCRFFMVLRDDPERWLELDSDCAGRLRFALHLMEGQLLQAKYQARERGLLLNVPFLPFQEYWTLSLVALEPIEFAQSFPVHPEFGQFALNYLTERLGLTFQEAIL